MFESSNLPVREHQVDFDVVMHFIDSEKMKYCVSCPSPEANLRPVVWHSNVLTIKLLSVPGVYTYDKIYDRNKKLDLGWGCCA